MKEFPNEINYLQSYTSWDIKHSDRKTRQCHAGRIEHAKRSRALVVGHGLPRGNWIQGCKPYGC